jgi:Tol biopolymer transport system component
MSRRPVITLALLASLLPVPGFTGLAFNASAAAAVAHPTTRASVATSGLQANGRSAGPAISASGRYVAFASEGTSLVAGDTNGAQDVFVRDRITGATTRVSISTSGRQANDASFGPATISADGRYVAFSSIASNLVAGDTNGATDVFVRDRVRGTTTLVSAATSGASAGGGEPAISADGRYVAFISSANNLVAGDVGDFQDVFVRDLISRTTTRVSVATGGTQANGDSFGPAAISANGRYIAFGSSATNLVAGATSGVFVRDRVGRTTTLVSVATGGAKASGAQPAISADGRYVAFASIASNLVAGDTNGIVDVFVRDRFARATTRVNISTLRAQTAHTDIDTTREDSTAPAISADGRYVAFLSGAGNLVARDTNAAGDAFVHDRVAGTTTRVSVATAGTQANQRSTDPAISADGRYVTFSSDASNLVAGDTNGTADVFVRAWT